MQGVTARPTTLSIPTPAQTVHQSDRGYDARRRRWWRDKALYVEGTLIMEGIMLANGWADPTGSGTFPSTAGGAVFLANGGNGTFTRTTFRSNSASLGGAVGIERGAVGT